MLLTLNEAWNKREISTPSDLIKVPVNPTIIECLERNFQVLSSALETFRDEGTLRTELFVVSRYLHRRKAQIRRHKTRQVLSQVQSCLKRLEELNLSALLTRTHQHVIKARRSQQTGGVVYLPSRGMMEHVLVKLMGGAGLLVQTVNYCVNAIRVLQADVKLAHLLPSTMMCLAAVCRIWACSRSLYLDCVSWYTSLLPELNIFPKGQVWLSKEEFPQDLSKWLDHRLDMEHITRSPMSTEESMMCAPLHVTQSGEGSSHPSHDESDPGLTVSLQRTDEDIGAPVKISREELGIKYNSAARVPKNNQKKKRHKVSLERESNSDEQSTHNTSKNIQIDNEMSDDDVTIETESSSDEEPSYNTSRKFQFKGEMCDSDKSSNSPSPSLQKEKPRLTGIKRRQEKDSISSTTSTTKKLRLQVSDEEGKSKFTGLRASEKERQSVNSLKSQNAASETNVPSSCSASKKTHMSTPVEPVTTTSAKSISPSSHSAPRKMQEVTSVEPVATSSAKSISSSLVSASKKSQESSLVKCKETSASDASSSSEEEPSYLIEGMKVSTGIDSEEEKSIRNIDIQMRDGSSSASDEETEVLPDVPNPPSTEQTFATSLQLKRLKQEITDCNDVQEVVDIFFRFKPEETSMSTPWDTWPVVGHQKKKELFDKKIENIENCIRKTAKRKVLSKLKLHCFKYIKEIKELTQEAIAETMTREALSRYVKELDEKKLTWLGKTISLPARKAKILEQKLKSLLRKMIKVNNNVIKLSLLQKKAGQIVLCSLQPMSGL